MPVNCVAMYENKKFTNMSRLAARVHYIPAVCIVCDNDRICKELKTVLGPTQYLPSSKTCPTCARPCYDVKSYNGRAFGRKRSPAQLERRATCGV